MQHEITAPQRLLNESGNIAEPGFAKKLYWQYDRGDIKARKSRIKEWDYYYIGTDEYALCLTVSDAGYVSCLSVSVLTFGKEPSQLNDSEIGLFPLGKLGLPATSEKGNVHARVGTADMTFENNGARRRLHGSYDNFCNSKKCCVFDVELTDFPEESMVIATPFNKDRHFYYNQKINCMRAAGFYEFDGKRYEFSEKNNALATLDWGRGVWTYDNVWYWGSGQCVLPGGDLFGFNIGYGFGDTSQASENMLFFNGRAHKLDEVKFNIPKNGSEYLYTEEWTFTSSDGRFEMRFKPIIDRQSPLDLKVLCMLPHQVFGLMSGRAVLDDGSTVEVTNMTAFAERVHNKW
ncbi:MAG: DUF2804 domain-containing protein [Clostridiales bacterium]|nr:DUF2804 domain-containing protein [Clostridiales bacterium]